MQKAIITVLCCALGLFFSIAGVAASAPIQASTPIQAGAPISLVTVDGRPLSAMQMASGLLYDNGQALADGVYRIYPHRYIYIDNGKIIHEHEWLLHHPQMPILDWLLDVVYDPLIFAKKEH